MSDRNAIPIAALFNARLAESGLDAQDAKKLRLEPLQPSVVASLGFHARPALKIPYFDPLNPSQPLTPKPGWDPFYRLRYLGPEPPGFAQQADKKDLKYIQPPKSGICAYFSRGYEDWPEVIKDDTIPILITEGEFKAAKGCKEGFPTIGLGGVWSWRAAVAGVSFLPELEQINWVKRTVYMVFDSDSSKNPKVAAALWALAEEIAARGALPFMVTLPELLEEGVKTGLDDFLVAQSAANLNEVMHEAEPLTLANALWRINQEIAYVRDPGLIVVRKTGQRLSPQAFTSHAYTARPYVKQELADDGSIKLKSVSAPDAWLNWPIRAEVPRMVYSPGESRETEEGYNLWAGWGCEPRKGDVGVFMTLMKHIFKQSDPKDMEWLLDWFAAPLQKPGLKLFTSVVIQGIEQGTGKSLIGYTVGAIYGKNFTEIRQGDLHGDFNSWAENKQFILADDVSGSTARKDADMLKTLITQKECRINVKFIPTYTIADRINWMFTTNHPDAFFLEDTDRRFFIHEVKVKPLPDDFYTEYQRWLNNGGPSALFYYLQHRDISKFNPMAAARRTKAKDLMIQDNRSDLASWVRGLLGDPDSYLRAGTLPLEGDLFSSRQLLSLYDPLSTRQVTVNGFNKEMHRAGAISANMGQSIRDIDGKGAKFYALKNSEKWQKARAGECRREVLRAAGLSESSVTKAMKY